MNTSKQKISFLRFRKESVIKAIVLFAVVCCSNILFAQQETFFRDGVKYKRITTTAENDFGTYLVWNDSVDVVDFQRTGSYLEQENIVIPTYITLEDSALKVRRISGEKFSTFSHLSNLKSLTIGDGIEIEDGVIFTGCETLETVSFGKNCTLDAPGCFANCSALVSVDLSDISTLREEVFHNCTSLTDINIDGVKEIGNYAFSNTGLVKVTIPAGCEISWSAFDNCQNLQEVTFGSTYYISSDCFRNCANLKTVKIDYSDTKEFVINSNAFYGCSLLSDINLEGVAKIKSEAFKGCDGLENINLSSVESISSSAFRVCQNLKNVFIGEKITTIEDNAFRGCYALDSLYCMALNSPTITGNTFESVDKSEVVLIVPCNTSEIYGNAQYWSDFTDIQEDCNVALNDVNTEIAMFVYPNPAKDVINITSSEQIEAIEIINLAGQTVYSSKENSKNVTIATQTFEKGSYLVQIHTAKGLSTQKIVIE